MSIKQIKELITKKLYFWIIEAHEYKLCIAAGVMCVYTLFGYELLLFVCVDLGWTTVDSILCETIQLIACCFFEIHRHGCPTQYWYNNIYACMHGHSCTLMSM